MTKLLRTLALITVVVIGPFATGAAAQMRLEEGFQDMFVTAGYSAAAGATIGAAVLSFQDNPGKHLKFISIGASIGLLSGTLFGGWIAVVPLLVDSTKHGVIPELAVNTPGFVVRPHINSDTFSLNGIEAGAVLARF